MLKITDHELRQKIDAALEHLGLTSAQYSVLSVIESGETMTSAELARKCFVSPQTMNRILQNLEKDGFVKKSANPDHGLKLDYTFTNKAIKTLCDAHVAVNDIELKMVKGLSKKDIDTLQKLLDHGFKNLRKDSDT